VEPSKEPWTEEPWAGILEFIADGDRQESAAIIRHLESLPDRGAKLLARVRGEIDRMSSKAIEPDVAALREAIGLARPPMPDDTTLDVRTLGKALNDEPFFVVFHEALVVRRPTARGLTYAAFHGGGSCAEIAELLQRMLPRGISPQVVHWEGSSSRSRSLVQHATATERTSLQDMNHDFIRVMLAGQRVIVDGAWRQFVIHYVAPETPDHDPDRDRRESFKQRLYSSTPPIFVGTFNDLQAQLAEVLGWWGGRGAGGGAFELNDLLDIWL
jgi:hypothetical protein